MEAAHAYDSKTELGKVPKLGGLKKEIGPPSDYYWKDVFEMV